MAVSIHAPRVGCDLKERDPDIKVTNVSIHAPRVGCDSATRTRTRSRRSFNSRTPCGVRPSRSIHVTATREFQFTHPVWGATPADPNTGGNQNVSIHAPRVGCDASLACLASSERCFNSRTPCGVRLETGTGHGLVDVFQFTHPVWGATDLLADGLTELGVSIHAPRVGCDSKDLATSSRR